MVEKTLICPSNSVNSQKQRKKGLKSRNLFEVLKSQSRLIFLRNRDEKSKFHFNPIISQKKENGGVYT